MFFKNITAYKINLGSIDAEDIESALNAKPLTEPGAMDMMTRGFVPVFEGRNVFTADGCMLVAVGICEKLLPGLVVTQAAKKRAAEIAEKQGYKVGRKQMREIAEQIVTEMLPHAFVRTRKTHAYIDSKAGLLLVDAATPSKSDEFIDAFSKSVPDAEIHTLRTTTAPALAMTNWLQYDDPDPFTIDNDAELLAPDETGAKVRYTHHSLDGDDIAEHLGSGKLVTKLGMTWDDRISFVMDEYGRVKRIMFLDIIMDQSKDAQTAEEQFEIDFTIMAGEFRKLVTDLIAALGGEKVREVA
jgi:recombination associated protein RdgC